MKKRTCVLIIYVSCYLCHWVSVSSAAAITENASSQVEPVVESNEATEADRIKRQHDNGANNIKGLLGSVLNKKLGLIGSLSSVSSSSKGTGAGHGTFDAPPPPPPPRPFDWSSLKKSIIQSLIQAVKAITGGVIALNGQLVKVKGHLLAVKGHLLNSKGDAITNFGKHVATNAFGHITPPHRDGEPHDDAGTPSAPSSDSGFGVSGPSAIHSPLDSVYPHGDFKSAIAYPGGYLKEYNPYSKRAAPSPNEDSDKETIKNEE